MKLMLVLIVALKVYLLSYSTAKRGKAVSKIASLDNQYSCLAKNHQRRG
ncbi:MAG: hypothetical protein V3R93_06280 [Candidatus Hydrothermarchaeaceae archaeon]